MRSPSETRWLWRFAVFTALLTSAPYLIAFARAGTDWVFTGFLFAVDDGNSYIAKMLSGTQGAWAFRSPYSTFPQNGLFGVYLQYLLLGKLAGGAETHLQLVALFHLFRIAGGMLYVFAVHDFVGVFVELRTYKRLATVLAVFGGGLGWVFMLAGPRSLFGDLPLDFYSPEAFGFLEVFGLPHLAAARALMLWGFVVLFGRNGEPTLSRGVRGGLLWLAAGLLNPLAPAIAMLISGLYAALLLIRPGGERRFESVRMFAAAILIPLPLVGYNIAAAIFDPFFRAWSEQNTILSPPPWHYLAAYILYLPFAIRGGWRLLISRNFRNRLPVIWVLIVPILVYLPINIQRRLAEGAFIALLVLFVSGLDFESPRWKSLKTSYQVIFVFVSTSFIFFAGSLLNAWTPGKPSFRPREEIDAFEFLAKGVSPGSVVLAPVGVGNALPAFAPVRVVIGHGPETIGFEALRPQVEAFFSRELTDLEAAALLDEQGVDYVFWPELSLPGYSDLDLRYASESIIIYAVSP